MCQIQTDIPSLFFIRMWQLGRILRMYQDKLMIDSTSHNVLSSEFVTMINIKRDTQSFQSVSLQIILLLLGYHIEMSYLTQTFTVLINTVLYSGKEIASFGQTSAHVPHSVQVSASIE